MSRIKQNVTHPQAKHSVSINSFDKTDKTDHWNPQNRVLIVRQRPKGSIQKKPGEHSWSTESMREGAVHASGPAGGRVVGAGVMGSGTG